MLEVTHEFTGASLANLDKRIERGVKYGRYEVGKLLYKAVALRVAQIYVRPIPTKAQVRRHRRTGFAGGRIGGDGTKAWKRTNALRTGQRLRLPDKSTAVVAFTGRAAIPISTDIGGYAQRRHNLGVTWQPKAPALGIVRRNPFLLEAMYLTRGKIAPTFKAGFDRGMR